MSLSPDHLLVHGFYLSYAVLPRLYWKRVCWTGVCLYITECWLAAGGDDDAVDVSANVGWSHAAASDTETQTTVDRQTDLLSYNSWSCELYSNTQHTSRWWRQGQLLLDIARWHKGRPMYDLIRLLLCKKWVDGGGGHCLVRMEWRPAGWSVCLHLLIFPCSIESRSFLTQAHPGGPGKMAVKRLWCGVVAMLLCRFWTYIVIALYCFVYWVYLMLVQFFGKNYDRKSIWSVKTLSSYLQQFFLGENLTQPGVILVKKASLKQKTRKYCIA